MSKITKKHIFQIRPNRSSNSKTIASPSLVSGFTIVELVVSIAIIAMITSIVMFDNLSFRDKAALKDSAFEVVLAIREAQISATSIVGAGIQRDDFESGYGVKINGQNDQSITLFANRCNDPDNQYSNGDVIYSLSDTCLSGSVSDELVREVKLKNNNLISEVCYVNSGGNDVCNNQGLYITFIRPDADASLNLFNQSNDRVTDTDLTRVHIKLVSPRGSQKQVVVTSAGQISIEDI